MALLRFSCVIIRIGAQLATTADPHVVAFCSDRMHIQHGGSCDEIKQSYIVNTVHERPYMFPSWKEAHNPAFCGLLDRIAQYTQKHLPKRSTYEQPSTSIAKEIYT